MAEKIEVAERVKVEVPVVGEAYQVDFHDCCIEGGFTATLVRITYEDPDPDPDTLVFDNGVELSVWGGVSFYQER